MTKTINKFCNNNNLKQIFLLIIVVIKYKKMMKNIETNLFKIWLKGKNLKIQKIIKMLYY